VKISRERILKELLGMLKGPRPELAYHYITFMGLFDIIFAVPPNMDVALPSFALEGTSNVRKIVKYVISDLEMITTATPHVH
jgi:tRNA nucleotidyltransferase/poly(A) polymerase